MVCLEKSLYLFDLETMRRLQDMDTARNPRGLVALTPREEPRYVKEYVYVYVLCQLLVTCQVLVHHLYNTHTHTHIIITISIGTQLFSLPRGGGRRGGPPRRAQPQDRQQGG